MNVLSLFDGMSCGQIALKELGIIPDIYYASEIDKHAIAQTQLNFPNTIQLGSVVNVDVSKLQHIDLLIGGSPCFVKGTKVICRDEVKNIEDVVVGDYVLTHNNRFNKVLATGYCFNNTIKVNCQGIMPITTTHEHPFYVREMSYKYDNKRRTSYRYFEEPKWKMASDLKKGDFLGFPILNTSENPLEITEDEAYIIGRYIADGHTRKDYRLSENRPNDRHWQLILSVGYKKLDEFNNSIKLKHSCYKHTKSVYRCVFSSKRLVEIVEKHCGIGASNKYFSMMLLNLPVNILKRVLDGYLSGDGCLTKGTYSTSSISKDINIGLALAVAKVYRVGVSYCFSKKEPTCIIEGRVVNQSDCHTMSFKTETPIQANYKVIGDSVWLPVRDVIETECKEQVFNLEVENDNSYTANGVYVHNCQSFSFAGKRKGMSTKCEIEITKLEQYLELKEQGFEFEGQSYLFWEYMRILIDIRKYNPEVKFLLENVEMGAKWERVLSEAIGIYGVHINSALVSAQNRARIYWTNIRTKQVGLFGEVYSDIPQPEDKGIVLKDILESEVDSKYYLSERLIDCLQNRPYEHLNMKPRDVNNKSACLCAGMHRNRSSDNYIIQLNPSKESGGKQPYQQNRIYHENGKLLALMTEQRGYIFTESALLIKEATKKGYTEIKPGECFDYENPESKTRRGRKMESKSNSLMAQNMSFMKYTENCHIRKLTPLECSRLQTIPSWYVWNCSDTQAYKLLGNGWNIETVKHIFKFMK